MAKPPVQPFSIDKGVTEMAQEPTREEKNRFYSACVAGELEEVRQLFDITPFDAHTASLMLRSGDSADIARFLLEKGADLGQVVIEADVKKWSPEKLILLADAGLDMKAEGHKCLQELVDRRDMLDLVLDLGADINEPFDNHLRNPESDGTRCDWDHTLGVLNNAAATGDTALFDHLVARGADPSKSIALHHACRGPQEGPDTVAMITHLVERYHFDINADDSAGGLRVFGGLGHRVDVGPPLVWAVLNWNEPAVRELLRRGADPKAAGGAPLRLATGGLAFSGFLPAVEPLLAAGADATQGLITAVTLREPEDEEDNLKAIKLCLEYGADPVEAEKADAADVAEEQGEEDGYSGMSSQKKSILEDYKYKRPQSAIL